MTQQEAIEQINVRGVYRHALGQLYTVSGFGEHARNVVDPTVTAKEKEIDVILTRKPTSDGKADVLVVPALLFMEPMRNGDVRFTEIPSMIEKEKEEVQEETKAE